LLQQGLRNPLAAPETLGIQGGGLLALALVVLYQPYWLTHGAEWVAFAGGVLAAGLVLALAARRQNSPLALLLAGMLVSLLSGSLLTILLLNHDLALVSLLAMNAGSLTQDGWQPVQHLWPRLVIVGVLMVLIARPLRLLEVGDQAVRSFGVSPAFLRLLTMLLAIYLSATVVSQVGVISFVALAAPLLARMAGAQRLLPRLICAALLGSALLLVTDWLVAWLPGGGSGLRVAWLPCWGRPCCSGWCCGCVCPRLQLGQSVWGYDTSIHSGCYGELECCVCAALSSDWGWHATPKAGAGLLTGIGA
jgi:iron complex transport system permease protein